MMKLKMGRRGYLSLKSETEILELILYYTSWLILSINDKYNIQEIKLSERKKNIWVKMILIYGNKRWFKYDWDWFVCKQAKSVPVIFEPLCIYKYMISRKYSLSTNHCTVETTHHN